MAPISPSTSSLKSRARTRSIPTRPWKKQKMSITQTYSLAHSARGKLSKAAARSDHDLRVLVGHANLLDSVMLDLAQAEQEQGRWFAANISHADEEAVQDPLAGSQSEHPQHSHPDAESDSDDPDLGKVSPSKSHNQTRRSKGNTRPLGRRKTIEPQDQPAEEADSADEEDLSQLTLTRVASRHECPPELEYDSDSDDDDDDDQDMPPSPPSNAPDTFLTSPDALLPHPGNEPTISTSKSLLGPPRPPQPPDLGIL